MLWLSADVLILHYQRYADTWRRDEIRALAESDVHAAELSRAKAAIFDQLGHDLQRQIDEAA